MQNPAGANGGVGRKITAVSRGDNSPCHTAQGGARSKRIPVPVICVGGAVSLLRTLAGRVRRLSPSHRDPEAFFVEKSEIEAELRGLALALSLDAGGR